MLSQRIEAPVLLIAFNRPETTTVVFEYIRRAKPTILYIALDAPRENKPYEDIVCKEVYTIVNRVDWDCDVKYKINEKNQGAEITISEAIKWVFEKEEFAIILEDDIVSPISFFKFAQEMLIKYKDDDRFCTVTSNNSTPIDLPNNEDYLFARYGHIWGWATWKRAWEGYDLFAEIKGEHLNLNYLRGKTNSEKEAKYYHTLFSRMKSRGKGNNTWDYMRVYYHFINDKLSIIPRVNLSANIGVLGLHATGRTHSHYRAFDENFIVKNHPSKIECNVEFDKHHFKEHIFKTVSFPKRVVRKLSRILSKI